MNASIMGMSTAGVVPLLGGGLLAAVGLRRRSLTGLLLTAAGGYLLYRGGRAAYAASLSAPDKAKCNALRERLGAGVTAGIYDHTAQSLKDDHDPIDDALDDSFPCSDPPSYSPRNEAGALV